MCDPTMKSPQRTMHCKSMPKVAKQISGFESCRRQIETGLLFMAVFYAIILSLNLPITPTAKFCPEDSDSCRRPDLIAYKLTSAIAMLYMGTLGCRNWYFSKEVRNASKGKPEDRLFGYLKAADDQNVANLCYQIWDLCVSLSIPEHREPVFLIHHILAGMTAFCALEFQMVSYYSVFYAGCSEFSSIFLVWADLNEFFPIKEGSPLDVFVFGCGVLFAVTFFHFRVVGWIRHSLPLWNDVLDLTRTGKVEQYRPGKARFLYLFLSLDVLLGALQLYWFGEIAQKVVEALG